MGCVSSWTAFFDLVRFNQVVVLSESAANADLLAYLRSCAQPATGNRDADLEGWELHTHLDLIERLGELAGSPRAGLQVRNAHREVAQSQPLANLPAL
jgi:hypothetical protein